MPRKIKNRLRLLNGAANCFVFDNRTPLSENLEMDGAEFVKKVKAAAKAKRVRCALDLSRGKGSHATLYFGDRFTIVKDRKKEIGPGLLASMLADLGLTKEDIK